jgi:hypothetical protein
MLDLGSLHHEWCTVKGLLPEANEAQLGGHGLKGYISKKNPELT